MKKFFKVLKSSENNIIMSLKEGRNLSILKIAQRGNAALQKEYETLLKLKKFSKIYNYFIPDVYLNKKIKSVHLKNKFHYSQKLSPGFTLSKLIQKNKIRSHKAQKASKVIIKNLKMIIEEDQKNCVNDKPTEIFRHLIMLEVQNLIKRPHLNFISSKLKLKIGKKYYNKLTDSLDKIFSKNFFLNLDDEEDFLVDVGHFNFHGENIIIPKMNELGKFKLIDPDTRWKVLDPMFSMARYFYTYYHDSAEQKKYYIKTNLFDFDSNNNSYFNIEMLWPKEINSAYKNMFDINLINKNLNKIDKLRFNLSYLLCLLRGVNANYEEKISFFKNKSNFLQNNGIFFSLLAIKFAHQIAFEK